MSFLTGCGDLENVCNELAPRKIALLAGERGGWRNLMKVICRVGGV